LLPDLEGSSRWSDNLYSLTPVSSSSKTRPSYTVESSPVNPRRDNRRRWLNNAPEQDKEVSLPGL
jgi:hypothetical protein